MLLFAPPASSSNVIFVVTMFLLLVAVVVLSSSSSLNVTAFILSPPQNDGTSVMDQTSSLMSPSISSSFAINNDGPVGRSSTVFSLSSSPRQETGLSATTTDASTEPYFLNEDDGWTSLSETRGVWWKKNVPEKEQTKSSNNGPEDSITIKYSGTLVGEDWWTPVDVADCWLKEIQGMDVYVDKILEEQIDASLLMDPDQFTESYVQTTFGIENKIQCKKFVMAAKRLQKVRDEFDIGTVFDSNDDGFEVDKNKSLIKGMRLAVDQMLANSGNDDGDDGDDVTDSVSVVCRSDFAYGSEGLRKSNGDVMVPPFATLRFDIERI